MSEQSEALAAFEALAKDYGYEGDRATGDWLTLRQAIERLTRAGDGSEGLDVERLAAALRREKVVGGIAGRYGAFNDAYYEQLAERLLATPAQPEQP